MSVAEGIFTALFTGLVTSVGPCVAPRYIAMIGLCAGQKSAARLRLCSAFLAGAMLGYLALANMVAVLTRALALSQIIYWAMAAALIASAMLALVRADRHQCTNHGRTGGSLGGSFFLGLSSCFVLSPCCAPVIAGFGVYGAGLALNPSIVVLAFCAGHFAPLVAGMVSSGLLPRVSEKFASASNVVSAGLLASMGAYYALLA